MNHRAGTEEQQRLEPGVGHEMKNARLISADTTGKEHVAQLRAS